MNPTTISILQTARRVAQKAQRVLGHRDDDARRRHPLAVRYQGQAASEMIREKLLAAEPCMITRIGATELKAALRFSNRKGVVFRNPWGYVLGKQEAFWWDDQIRWEMQYSSGFFPCTDDLLDRFARRFLRDIRQTDVLGSWLKAESELAEHLSGAQIVGLTDLEPYYRRDPWTTALEGRTVLVIHPFDISIRKQYEKREVLFADPRILTKFTLKTLKAVQSLGRFGPTGFKSWFDALDSMCARVEETNFDVALIGAGAYGLALAAFVKSINRKAIHLGGATQILFGIRGQRWDERPFFQQFFNEHWSRPLPEETPPHQQIESRNGYRDDGRCYW